VHAGSDRVRVVDNDDQEAGIDNDDNDQAGPPTPTTSTAIVQVRPILSCVFTSSFLTIHSARVQPSTLHYSNPPQEVTNSVLAVLFQQYVPMTHTTSPLIFRSFSDTRADNSPTYMAHPTDSSLTFRTRIIGGRILGGSARL
jgi:hypothetical protein